MASSLPSPNPHPISPHCTFLLPSNSTTAIDNPAKSSPQEMLQCLPPESPIFSPPAVLDPQIRPHPPQIQAASSAQPSPTLNLSRVYTTVVHTDSYKEMWSITRSVNLIDDGGRRIMLTRVLRPDRDCVAAALTCAPPTALTTLISAYFDRSEETTSICLSLLNSVDNARKLYWPLHTLAEDLHIDSLSQPHCDLVFAELLKFDAEENPFPRPDSRTFDGIRNHCADLKRQLERRLRKSSSRIRLVRHAAAADSSICCMGAACTAYVPPKFVRRELAYLAQIKVAERNASFLKIDVDTLDPLVDRLHNVVEDDKRLIRHVLKIGNDRHTIEEVLKELGKTRQNLVYDLVLLEEKICNCFINVNHSRSQLLQEISVHQTSSRTDS